MQALPNYFRYQNDSLIVLFSPFGEDYPNKELKISEVVPCC